MFVSLCYCNGSPYRSLLLPSFLSPVGSGSIRAYTVPAISGKYFFTIIHNCFNSIRDATGYRNAYAQLSLQKLEQLISSISSFISF